MRVVMALLAFVLSLNLSAGPLDLIFNIPQSSSAKLQPGDMLWPNLDIKQPRVAIIIDDIGDRYKDGKRVINLDGSITVSILPFTPYSKKLADYAYIQNKEVMLHLPMEAIDHRFHHKGTLTKDMPRAELEKNVDAAINAIPHVQGINNHMGSLLTQDHERMNWLMGYLASQQDLYFVDSRTIQNSVAGTNASRHYVRNASRDVFLDNSKDTADMLKQWNYFLKLANERGSAIIIAHPYPETIDFLEQHLPELEARGIKLVPMSELIQWRDTRRIVLWQ